MYATPRAGGVNIEQSRGMSPTETAELAGTIWPELPTWLCQTGQDIQGEREAQPTWPVDEKKRKAGRERERKAERECSEAVDFDKGARQHRALVMTQRSMKVNSGVTPLKPYRKYLGTKGSHGQDATKGMRLRCRKGERGGPE